MPKVFICYRREDSAYPAHQIYRDLTNHFGPESVVFDVDTIPLSTDFREYLNKEVSKCDILLAIIGDQWIEILKQRLDEPNDFVRIEIQAALEREIPVVPILVGKASVPIEKNLPPELAGLAYKQAAEVRAGPDLQTHLKRLIGGLDRLIAERKTEEELKQKEAEEERKRRAAEVRRRAEKERKQKEEQKFEAVPKTYTNSIGMGFVLIPEGSFTMGSQLREKKLARRFGGYAIGYEGEKPAHSVRIERPFYLQTTPVTQGQWQRVMGNNPSNFMDLGDDCPVEKVSWEDAQQFIWKINQIEKIKDYRLPSEAEWEYACRAGTTTEYLFGNDASNLGEYAWYAGNSNETHRVATKKPNAWGLYDMIGNVYEWVEDDCHGNYEGAPADGRAWVEYHRSSDRVCRGGSWDHAAYCCRSATRNCLLSDCRDYTVVGFRLARSVALGS